MANAYWSIPALIEFFMLLTIGAPLILAGRFRARPQLGIALWLSSFGMATAALIVLVAVLVSGLAETYLRLNRTSIGSSSWIEAFLASFVPWLLLALGGIALSALNNLATPHIASARQTRNLLDLAGRPRILNDRIRVLELDLPLPFASVAKYGGRATIVITKAAIGLLSSEELSAVLEHERAHIKLKHLAAKRVVTLASVLFPWLSTSRLMAKEVGILCELAADEDCAGVFEAGILAGARTKLLETI